MDDNTISDHATDERKSLLLTLSSLARKWGPLLLSLSFFVIVLLYVEHTL